LATTQVYTELITAFIKKLFYPVELALVDDWLFVKNMSKQTREFSICVFNINMENVYGFIDNDKAPEEYLIFDIRRGPDMAHWKFLILKIE